MRRWTSNAAVVVLALAVLMPDHGRAARDQTAARSSPSSQELIVLEAPNCIHCAVFRRDVLPRYQLSHHAGNLPIRFIDLNDPAADQLKLEGSITMVPTVVLMRGGMEAGRITGYWGPEAFFQGILKLLGDAG